MFLNSQLPTSSKLQMINYRSLAQLIAAMQMVVGLTLLVYSIFIGATTRRNNEEGFPEENWNTILYFILGSAYFSAMGLLLSHAVLKKSLRSCRYWSYIGATSVICSVIVQSVIWETQEDLIPFQLKALAEVCLVLSMLMILIGVGYYKELSDEAENSSPRFTNKPKSNDSSLRFESQESHPPSTASTV